MGDNSNAAHLSRKETLPSKQRDEKVRDSRVCLFVPSMLWMGLALGLGPGLGLGRKLEDRPEAEDGERDAAALLLGVLRGLLEVEQPRAGSCGSSVRLKAAGEALMVANTEALYTSLLPPLAGSFFFAGAALVLCCLSGFRLTFST